ncbi:MAG: nucleotidyltransferase family protein [Bryobacteraceae bacterium]
MTAGLILAAGESRRMGSPKALLDYRGETFLDRLIGLFAGCCSPVIAVLGAQAEEIRAGLRRSDEARVVENPDFRAGQLSSMQCGLRAVPAEAERVLFTLVDHPAVSPDTLTALVVAPAAPLCIPCYGGRRGHPILFSKALLREFLALPAGSAARDVVTRHASDATYINVPDPGILANIDDSEAYANLLAERGA